MKKKKRGDVMKRTKALIATLIDGAHPLVDIADRPWARLRYGSDLASVDAYWEKVAHERCVARLKKKKWVQQRKRGKQLILQLTSKGTIYALGQRIITTDKKLAKGLCCLVSFDIPESARQARNTLRCLLKEADFSCVHHSTWTTDRDVSLDLRKLIGLLGVTDWVAVYEARRLK